jgi:CHAD domain-containing protein
VKETLERELKLRAKEGFELPPLAGDELEPRAFVSTYHDTPDLRLQRAGATLRHRVENGLGLWQLKLPRGAARLELEVAGGPTTVPDELLRLLPGLTHRASLPPVARLRTRRVGVRVRENGRPLAEVVFDSVAVLENQRVVRTWEELEVELLEGDERTLRQIEKRLRRAGAGRPEPRTKLAQALALAAPTEPPAPRTPQEALRAMLALQLDRILAHDPGTRLGADIEDLHQLRVASRRLRAFLRAARPLLEPTWADELREELKWVGSALGPVRDLDVLIEHLRGEVAVFEGEDRRAAESLVRRLDRRRERARDRMLTALDDDRYLALLVRLEDAVESPRLLDDETTLASIWSGEFRKLRKAARAVDDDSPDEELHAVRIRAKRARYAAELAAGELGKPGERFVSEAKRLQDVLGEHQDSSVAEERIRALLKDAKTPAAHRAGGRLIEREHARRAAARAGFPEAWSRLERAGRKAAKA